MTVPFPAPDGPEMTKREAISVSEAGEELAPLTLGEPPYRFAGADAALLHDLRRLNPAALGGGHEEIGDLRGEEEFGRRCEHLAHGDSAPLEVSFKLSAAAPYFVRLNERLSPLIERALWGCVGLP